MSVQEDVWGWLHPALQDLRGTAGQSWDERRARFLDQLGLADPAEQPVAAALLHWLDELPDEERTTTLDSDQLDATAYELVQTQVSTPDDQHAFLESQSASEQEASFTPYGVTIAEPAASAGANFDWVTAEESAALTRIFGGDWQTALAADLTNRWGADWHTHPAEHKTAWLDDLIKSGQLEKVPEGIPAELAEIMDMINKLPSADQLDAELAGIPEAAEEEHAGLDELDELDADSNV